MSLAGQNILIILGGTYHDFNGFFTSMLPLFEAQGCRVSATYDLDFLARLRGANFNLVISYTCLMERQEEPLAPRRLTDEQVAGLVNWVQAGGAFLGIHAATVVGRSHPDYGKLLGGVFLSHPPIFSFPVYPLTVEHPAIAGIPAFEVTDEFYIQKVDPGVQVQMVAIHEGKAHPMVWSRPAGQGYVAYIAMGHSAEVWELPLYRQLLVQAAEWLIHQRK